MNNWMSICVIRAAGGSGGGGAESSSKNSYASITGISTMIRCRFVVRVTSRFTGSKAQFLLFKSFGRWWINHSYYLL